MLVWLVLFSATLTVRKPFSRATRIAPMAMLLNLFITTTLLAALPGAGGGGVAQPASRARAATAISLKRMEKLRLRLFDAGHDLRGGAWDHVGGATGEHLIAHRTQADHLEALIDLDRDSRTAQSIWQAQL